MAEATSREEDLYIDPKGKHPDNAVYVARDKKSGAEVSFDSWGRKLDSNGNVVQGDRQRAGDAGAKIARPKEQPQPKGPPQTSSGYEIGAGIKPNLTSLLGGGAPGASVGAGVAPRRSPWDKSFPQSRPPVLPPGATPVPSRDVPPGVLLPGGIDPVTGQRVATAMNGLLSPEMQDAPKPWRPPSQARMPWESFDGEYESPITRESMTAIPGLGMFPSSIGMQTGGLDAPPNRRFIPNEDMPYPPVGNSYQNRYIPETYSRPNVPVYDPSQLMWEVP